VAAAYSKRRREDSQPLRSALVALVGDWLRDKPAGKELWPGKDDARCESRWKHAAAMVREDLAAAGLPYADESGRVFDFHALRHLFISSLAAAGVHPKVAQSLARHSTITLTMDRYTHLGVLDQTAALDKLPELPLPAGLQRMAATGTEGEHVPQHVPAGEILCVSLRTAESGRAGVTAICHKQKTPELLACASGCDSMIAPESEAGPRGGTVDTRDLKSLLAQAGSGFESQRGQWVGRIALTARDACFPSSARCSLPPVVGGW